MAQALRRARVDLQAKRAPTVLYPAGSGDQERMANIRVLNMLEEATKFTEYLRLYEATIKQFDIATLAMFESIYPVLRAPVPRVWDDVEGGLTEPIRATVSHEFAHTAGGDWNFTGLKQVEDSLHHSLARDVSRPLQLWRESLGAVKDRMPELERLRGQAERRSRKVMRDKHRLQREYKTALERNFQPEGGLRNLLFRCTHPGADVPTSEPPESVANQELREEEINLKVGHKQRKYEASKSSYEQLESQIFEQLSGLVRDASWLKSYMAAALMMGKEAFQKAVVHLGSAKHPIPAFEKHTTVDHGATAPCFQLAASMPQFVDQGVLRKDVLAALAERIQPRRAAATPLELHARGDVSPSDMVPPVIKGASDKPLQAAIDQDLTTSRA